ncbi:MAG: UDP-glucose/GDP-mannose dehydrogenase family protein [Gammaproteobacteria bacterium]|nr:UDP-glucose/GDP-mannose dehydrogenase family protein [Gammaproteobacteria bacterium]
MKISVFGSGYVGLVSGACFAENGNDVVCLDVDAEKIARLRDGEIPFHEPGLDVIVRRNVRAGRLRFSTDAREAVQHGVVLLIAVGTPADEDGSADLSHILSVARIIGEHIDDYRVVVDKSTVPVGTGDKVEKVLRDTLALRAVSIDFDVVANPEFLKEGAAVADFMKPDRVIVGSDSPRAIDYLRMLYEPFTRSRERLLVMDRRSAELTKYAANAMLAAKISFINELAGLAERMGADIEKVRQGIGSDPRIGYHFIYPGAGYGGSCFPKDVKALVRTAEEAGMAPLLLTAIERVNERQKTLLLRKLRRYFVDLLGRRIAVWGLAFKPNTDDMREAPSRVLIEGVLAAGATVCAYDPIAMDVARRVFAASAGLRFSDNSMDALEGADALVIVTEWQEFRSPDFDLIKSRMKEPVIFDGRNLYDPATLEAAGIKYFAVGRGRPLALDADAPAC